MNTRAIDANVSTHRATFYYLRERSGKSARIKEKLPARKVKWPMAVAAE